MIFWRKIPQNFPCLPLLGAIFLSRRPLSLKSWIRPCIGCTVPFSSHVRAISFVFALSPQQCLSIYICIIKNITSTSCAKMITLKICGARGISCKLQLYRAVPLFTFFLIIFQKYGCPSNVTNRYKWCKQNC